MGEGVGFAGPEADLVLCLLVSKTPLPERDKGVSTQTTKGSESL